MCAALPTWSLQEGSSAQRQRGNASKPPALKLLLHFFPFLQNKLKCFFSYLELICSCSFCAVWDLPASSPGEIPVKPSGYVALYDLLYGDFCSPDLIFEETWCCSSTLRLEHTKSASWSSWFFLLSTYPYSLSSSLTISLLGHSFSLQLFLLPQVIPALFICMQAWFSFYVKVQCPFQDWQHPWTDHSSSLQTWVSSLLPLVYILENHTLWFACIHCDFYTWLCLLMPLRSPGSPFLTIFTWSLVCIF